MARETPEPSLYQRIPQLLGRAATKILLSGKRTEEISKADPSHGSAFQFRSLMMEKEGFTNILNQSRLAAALVCQQVSHLEGHATLSKGIRHRAVRWSFVSLCQFCAVEEGTVLKKDRNISSASM